MEEFERVKDPHELIATFESLGVDLMSLAKLSGARQAVSALDLLYDCLLIAFLHDFHLHLKDLKDPRRKEEIASARVVLKDATKMLLSSSRVCQFLCSEI